MRVFVAGATGAIGRQLVPMLLAAGHQVTGLARSEARRQAVERLGAQAVVADALDRDALVSAVVAARPEAVVHQLTSIPRALDPRRTAKQFEATGRLRTEGTRNLIEGAAEAGAGRFAAQSIAFAYAPEGSAVKDESEPLWADAPAAFAPTVAAVEELERQVLEANGAVLRYGHIYGDGTGYAPDGAIAEMVRKRRYPIVGDGGGVFSFVTTADAARAAKLALERDVRGVLNVVDDDPAPLREWLPEFARALGAPPPRRIPAWLARPLAGEFGVRSLTRLRGADNSRAKLELGWQPAPASWREGFAALGRDHHT
jgi:nucleoside-diphosphate-sugar epimerase